MARFIIAGLVGLAAGLLCLCLSWAAGALLVYCHRLPEHADVWVTSFSVVGGFASLIIAFAAFIGTPFAAVFAFAAIAWRR